jgi:TetR/AcrR family transcriptional repressor of nem operon
MLTMARTKEFDETKVLHDILMLFWEKGYHQSSLDDILRAGGISRQSMYDTYGDKKALFLKVLELYRKETKQIIEDKINELLEKGEPCVNILRDMIFYHDGKGCLAINSMVEFKASDKNVRKEIDALLLFSKEMIHKLVVHGQANGEITDKIPCEHITEALMNARTGFQVGQNYKLPSADLKNIADWTIDLIRSDIRNEHGHKN